MHRLISAKLKEWTHKEGRKPLILRGARQVGKTWSLLEFGKDEFQNCHYINFEKDPLAAKIFDKDLSPKRILDELSFRLSAPIHPASDLLILDEIGLSPRALTALKYFSEEMPELTLCAAGSLLGVTLGESSFPVGKVEFLDLFPLNFYEFLWAMEDEKSIAFIDAVKRETRIPEVVHDHLWEQWKRYLIVGGLPEAVSTFARLRNENLYDAFEQVRKKQQDLITAYHADVAKHSGKVNAMQIERVWSNVPAQLSREEDGGSSKFRFKDVVPGRNRFEHLAGPIDWLTAARLVIKVPIVNTSAIPLSAHTKENAFKLYFFDVGLLGAASDMPVKSVLDYDFGSYKGFLAENYVAQEFYAFGVSSLFCWQEGRSEVEFLREIEGNIIPIEVKSGWVTRAKSLSIYAQKYKPAFRAIFSAKTLTMDDENRVQNYPLYLTSIFPLRTAEAL
jgi:predicted AAA+ superfamily ATPase